MRFVYRFLGRGLGATLAHEEVVDWEYSRQKGEEDHRGNDDAGGVASHPAAQERANINDCDASGALCDVRKRDRGRAVPHAPAL